MGGVVAPTQYPLGRKSQFLIWRRSFTQTAMSRQDIVDYLELTIETVSRTLPTLESAATIWWPIRNASCCATSTIVLADRVNAKNAGEGQ